ncbi:MAG: hypothetical protein A2X25_00155 [Chloroflexi bacterium GWB2_49_20]|nr:MAG: hypothetical protein A2X25_00155 [Chloroflexi bacterium GWB2_49_20]OGN76921.1 MAG: hypothetical protein A2X26_13410 [Chloroflexi bacterium GWC2_49_37]OGN84883.1 MAG: hypothetical protein A2X27_15045 [Chloroflexi bacterium GWD2_49_16]HCM96588.1 hypothetical protein [Anaerolineae bacterium]
MGDLPASLLCWGLVVLGSPDPNTQLTEDPMRGDLRSQPGAGSGDPRPAAFSGIRDTRWAETRIRKVTGVQKSCIINP